VAARTRGGAANLEFPIDIAAISMLEFRTQNRRSGPVIAKAFSSEVDTGSHSNQVYADCVDLSAIENASKQESRASVLIQSEPIML
jgi:hypothetical protein